jgi:hypothetical protein
LRNLCGLFRDEHVHEVVGVRQVFAIVAADGDTTIPALGPKVLPGCGDPVTVGIQPVDKAVVADLQFGDALRIPATQVHNQASGGTEFGTDAIGPSGSSVVLCCGDASGQARETADGEDKYHAVRIGPSLR